MLKKIKNFFFSLFYALPFAMKGAEAEIMGATDSSDGTKLTVLNKQQENTLASALLKGEVTQEVEELRYQTYKVAQESYNYEYLGEDVAVKKEKVNMNGVITINNHIICEGVEHELKRVDDYGKERYVLNVKYGDYPRFKVEKYCNLARIRLNEKIISLYFEKETDEPERRMFYNEIERIINGSKSELRDNIQSIDFYTQDTFYKYSLRGFKLEEIKSNKFEYVLIYSFGNYIEENIVEKYHSDTMEEKYKNKERKNNTASIGDTDRKRYCSVCGKEINKYDGDISEQTVGYPVCQECMQTIKQMRNLYD